jgi:hypothetical protein
MAPKRAMAEAKARARAEPRAEARAKVGVAAVVLNEVRAKI